MLKRFFFVSLIFLQSCINVGEEIKPSPSIAGKKDKCIFKQDTNSGKIVRKIVANLHKYRIIIKDILTFLGINYRDASLIILYFIVRGNSIPKIR